MQQGHLDVLGTRGRRQPRNDAEGRVRVIIKNQAKQRQIKRCATSKHKRYNLHIEKPTVLQKIFNKQSLTKGIIMHVLYYGNHRPLTTINFFTLNQNKVRNLEMCCHSHNTKPKKFISLTPPQIAHTLYMRAYYLSRACHHNCKENQTTVVANTKC